MDISRGEETTEANGGKQRGWTMSKGQPVWSKTDGREGFGQWPPNPCVGWMGLDKENSRGKEQFFNCLRFCFINRRQVKVADKDTKSIVKCKNNRKNVGNKKNMYKRNKMKSKENTQYYISGCYLSFLEPK